MAKSATKTSTKQSTNGTIQAVDLPVGVAARAAESVRPLVELRNREAFEPHIQRIRDQIATELKQSEKRGAELRREAVQRVQPLRDRVGQQVDRVGQQVDRVKERISALR